MTQITVNEQFQPNKYLLVSRLDENQSIVTTRIIISDENTNTIRVVSIEQGPQGARGEVGPQGLPGKDAPTFDILPISSGGTNNSIYTSGNIIYYDGSKLSSAQYSIQDILDQAAVNTNAVTGVLAGNGLQKTDGDNTVTLDVLLGEGLQFGNSNEIIIDNTIARVAELNLGQIDGTVPISKGGTNNTFYTQNRLVYFDGTKIRSFPISTGNFLFSGVSVNIVAGSGLVGGGNLEIPNGTVAINIPSSADIIVEDDLIQLSNTGIAGTYSKIVTDDKGRVISGTTLTALDIVEILGYTPFHPGNDGSGSNLDADLLDGYHGSHYLNAINLTGLINPSIIPSSVEPGIYTKIGVGANGLVSGVFYADQADIISSLGYVPVPNSGNKTIAGSTTIDGDIFLNGELSIYDHLPILATDNSQILPDTPRGISFIYGGLFSTKTGILAYYPAANELRLVTNVFASGADTDAGGNQDDLNGGNADSIFILQNLDGDSSTILLRNIADNLYVKTQGDEEIAGQKVFVDNIIFRKQIRIDDPAGNSQPPFFISSNTNKVINLNADLLDDQDGSYYRNAANITGAFSYNNVSFDHIEGTNRYLSKFNDTNDPANKIDDSVVYQDNLDNVVIDNNQNLIIGNANLIDAESSVNIGRSNTIDGNNNIAVGINNAITGNNSVVLNSNSSVNANNSIALGEYGHAYLPKQVAHGVFNTLDNETNTRLEHGQYTTISMHLPGTEAGSSWVKLQPSITIPNNKTFAYNLDLLITKAFGTGVAQYRFESGIFKNATFRDSNNITSVINVTTQPQISKKLEIFNNSQIKNHYHTFEHVNGQRQLQDVSVTHTPIKFNALSTENINQYYLYESIPKTISGTYYKTNDGHLVLDAEKPIYSGNFTMDTSIRGIKIFSKNHGLKPGSSVNLSFKNVTGWPIADATYNVYSVLNKDIFIAETPLYSGYIAFSSGTLNDYAHILLSQNSIAAVDKLYMMSGTSGTISNNGYIDNIADTSFLNNIRKNSTILIEYNNYLFNRLVSTFDNNSITVNTPIATGTGAPQQPTVVLAGPVNLYQIDFSYTLFNRSPKIFIDTNQDGEQFLSTSLTGIYAKFQGKIPFVDNIVNIPSSASIYSTGNYVLGGNVNTNTVIDNDYSDLVSIAINNLSIPKRSSYPSGRPVQVSPLIDNSGSVFFTHQQTLDGSFLIDKTQFNKYRCVYTRYNDNINNDRSLLIYATGLNRPINLPFTPVIYELCSGYKDDDNNIFEIINDNDRYRLQTTYPLNYEEKNIFYIRLKAKDRSDNEFYEKNFTITVNDTTAPYGWQNIPNQSVDISETFDYTLDSSIFNEEENQGELAHTASLQNGSALPDWLVFNANNLNFSGSPNGCDLGTYNIRVFASNNSDTIYRDFYLTVTDSTYQVFNSFVGNNTKITDIILSNITIDENLPSGSIISYLDCQGSFNPYLEFISTSNSFTGVFQNNADIVECLPIINILPTTVISGTSDLLQKNSLITVNGALGLSSDLRAIEIYKPFMISGSVGLVDGTIYPTEGYKDYSSMVFSGLIINASGHPAMPRTLTTLSSNDYSIFVGDREALSTEIDPYPDTITTEAGNDIVVRHNIFRPMWMATDQVITTPTGILIEIDEAGDGEDKIIIVDQLDKNVIWASGYPGCNDKDLIENILVAYTPYARDYDLTINTDINLENINHSPPSGLKRSNIKYNIDTWSFIDPIDNPVLAIYGIGSGDFCHIKTEADDPINAEDDDRIISTQQNHHGTRIVLNTTYELFDSYEVVKDNGKLLADTFNGFICENNEPIVHDYAIAARSGDACILFPGERNGDFRFIYESDIDMLDSIYNYYYNWGKLIQFSFVNYKSFIKLNDIFLGSNNTKSRITYNEFIPTNNYPISGLKYDSFIYPALTGCGTTTVLDKSGFESSHGNSGNYVTGLVDVYTEPGTGVVNLTFNTDINFDNRYTNNIYLDTINSSNNLLQLPNLGRYSSTIVDADTIQIHSLFLMPNSGIQFASSNSRTGTFSARLDENHGYVEELNTIINRIPIEFINSTTKLNGINTNVTARPKDYTFDIISISGNKLFAKDNKNYFLKENGRLDYYDQNIHGKYLTNGVTFSGSLFNNHRNIYDIRHNLYTFLDIYPNINFQYNHANKLLSLTIDSGIVHPYDNIIVTFPTGYTYSNNRLYSLIEEKNIVGATGLRDLEPYKDSLLLETSTSLDSTDTSQVINLTGVLSANSNIFGTCTINTNLVNRLQSGLLINHNNSDLYGYEINELVPGFAFTGVIPKNNNVISADIATSIDNNHIGHASVFGTGIGVLYSGARILRQATSEDIGFSEYYLINSNSTVNILVPSQYWWQSEPQLISAPLTPTGINGIGTTDNPYNHYMAVSGSSTSKYIEFLYLGQNSNTIKLYGPLAISGNITGFKLYHTTFDQQISRYRDLVNREVPVVDTLIFTTGITGTGVVRDNLDIILNVNRFDKIKVEISTNQSNSTNFANDFNLSTYVISDVSRKPYILESNNLLNNSTDYYPYINPEDISVVYTPLPLLNDNGCPECDTSLPQYIVSEDPNYSVLRPHNFYVLPYIKTNHEYCGVNYDKNQKLFFNGNIIKINQLDTIKSFLQQNDEIYITRLNNQTLANSGVTKHLSKFNTTNEYGIISGIAIDGDRSIPPRTTGVNAFSYPLLKENEFRYNAPLGISHNEPLPIEGDISFIKATSGQIKVLNYNNLYYHTYGGVSSYYPLDTDGNFVQPPQTGRYSIIFDNSACTSGTLCVHITGYNSSVLTGVFPGKNLFFDFDDGLPEISKQYPINDLLQNSVISLSIPYNVNHINKSGLVYLIDSTQNIKSHLNPNINNGLIQSNGSLQGLSQVNSKIFNYYDIDSKRWKHTVHLSGNQPPYTGYNISLSSTATKLYSINPNKLQISGIQYSFGDLNNFTPLSNNLIIPDNVAEVVFKITTKDGDQSLFDIVKYSIPKISMSGIGIYRVEFDEPGVFGWYGSGWNIGLRWNPPKENYTNRPVVLQLSDFTGDTDLKFNITQRQLPDITPFYPTGYVGSGNMWQMGFDISKIDVNSKLLANEIFLELTNVPDANHYVNFYADSRSVMYSGDTRGAQTGIYNIVLTVKDITTTPYTTLGVCTGVINVLDHIASRPDHVLQFNNVPSTYYININEQDNIIFDIPAELGPLPSEVINSLNINFNTSNQYHLNISSSSYDYDTDRFKIIAIPVTTGDNPVYKDTSGRFINQSVSVSLKQPVYDTFGNYVYQTYTKNIGFNTIFYKPLIFEGISQQNILNFDTNEPWSIEFYIASGITEHDPSNRPNAKIFDAPGFGTYETDIAQYSLNYEYDTSLKKWKVQAVANKDAIGRYVASTGIYPITIFSEDEYSGFVFNTDYSIRYSPITRMRNIQPTVYTTPDNQFFTKVDVYDLDENASNEISFPSILKESSIQIPTTNISRKYDRDLNLWTNAYTSSKMLDKYDSRLSIDGNVISVECRGIGKDKIMAVGKLSTMEIESNELAGIPLKITGITNYSSDTNAAIDVAQGDKAWVLQFKTIGGLAHANYPPTILLENMPTFCTGYNPLEDTQLQCLVKDPLWNPNDQGGSWSYHFSGLPSCILLGRKEFSITAIDTDTSLLPSSPYLPNTDSVDFAFNYLEGQFLGNPPKIQENDEYADMGVIKPLCNTYYTKQLDFGPGPAALCTNPTGIKTILVSGSVPPGLSYSLYFPEDGNQPVEPYSNLGSGYLRIEGYPTSFANGGAYDEKILLKITDARDRTVEQLVTFTDASTAFEPDAAITVYFSTGIPMLTPKSGLKPITATSVNGWRPPPIPESLECRSVLPHNKCTTTEVLFSGTEAANDLNIYLHQPNETNTNKLLSVNDIIYIGFDSYNNGNNGVHTVYNNEIGLHISGQESLQNPSQIAPITGYGTAAITEYKSINISNFDSLFSNGNIKNNTTTCLLGGGRALTDLSSATPSNNRGLLGLLVPSYAAKLTGSLPFATSDYRLTKLRLDSLNNPVDTNYTVSWSDCWQTGNLYISGIVLPKITAEIVDPPPAQDYYFSFNGVRFALATKLSFGDNATQRLIPENERNGTLQYELLDIMSGTILQKGSVSAGSSFDTNTLSRTSGTVYKLNIRKDSDAFPTYNVNALPGAQNSYIWPHKGDNLLTIPIQTTFSPIVTDGFDNISVINSLSDSDPNGVVMDPVIGLAVGGYIPDDAGIGNSIPYNWSGNGVVSGAWTTENYLPRITGIIQESLLKSSISSGSASYTYADSVGTITVSNSNIEIGDAINFKFYSVPQFGGATLRHTSGLIVESNNIEGDNFVMDINLGITSFVGVVYVDFYGMIEAVDTGNNQLVLRDNFDYQIGDSIGVDLNNFVSTALNLLKENGYVSVASASDSKVYLSNTNTSTGWLMGFGSGDLVSIYKNIDDNIKIMPYNINYITEGKYSFQITGRSNTRENEDLIYKIGIMENPNMPIFDNITYPSVNMVPKQYFQNYTLHINKPISINTGTINKAGNILTFSVEGGKRPIADNIVDVQLAAGETGDYGYCGFWRITNNESIFIKDEYDSTNDRLNIRIDLDPKYGIDWSIHNTIKIRVADETGVDTYIYTF